METNSTMPLMIFAGALVGSFAGSILLMTFDLLFGGYNPPVSKLFRWVKGKFVKPPPKLPKTGERSWAFQIFIS